MTHEGLIRKTIRADLKTLGVKVERDGMIYKGDICIGDLPLDFKGQDLFLFLQGMSAVFDNKELFFKEEGWWELPKKT